MKNGRVFGNKRVVRGVEPLWRQGYPLLPALVLCPALGSLTGNSLFSQSHASAASWLLFHLLPVKTVFLQPTIYIFYVLLFTHWNREGWTESVVTIALTWPDFNAVDWFWLSWSRLFIGCGSRVTWAAFYRKDTCRSIPGHHPSTQPLPLQGWKVPQG